MKDVCFGTAWAVRAGLAEIHSSPHVSFSEVDEPIGNPSLPKLEWFGHASFALFWRNVRILIDPVFANWIGIFPRRIPLPNIDRLKGFDVALISHGHMDHLDNRTLGRLNSKMVVVPQRTERFLSIEVKSQSLIQTISIGESIQVGSLSITSTYAQHGGWRYPWQKGYWATGYVISDEDSSIFYSGDSAYGTHFGGIGKEISIDTAILPIGAYSPQWFLKKRHMNPPEAIQAFEDLRARRCIPCHFGTYRLSLENLDEPIAWFAQLAEAKRINWELPIGLR